MNGKRDDFEREDLIALANLAGIKRTWANNMIESVLDSVRRWPDFAEKAGVSERRMAEIQSNQRINF
jgi:serine/threonine-protein kinase HipA